MHTVTHSGANISDIVCGKNKTYPSHRGVLHCRLDPVARGRGVLLQLNNPARAAFAFIRWWTEEVRISFLSNTVADLKDLWTRIISETPSKPSQIPLKKPRAVQIRTGFVSTAKCWKSIYSVCRPHSSAGCMGNCGGSEASEAAKREVTSATSEVPKGREICYADHVVLAERNTISLMLSLPFMDKIIPKQSFLEPAIIWACIPPPKHRPHSRAIAQVYLRCIYSQSVFCVLSRYMLTVRSRTRPLISPRLLIRQKSSGSDLSQYLTSNPKPANAEQLEGVLAFFVLTSTCRMSLLSAGHREMELVPHRTP